jgi:undecaprenyl-diphosphatase
MFSFDKSVVHFLNSYMGLSVSFDQGMVYLSDANLLKLTPMILVLWGFWFKKQNNDLQLRNRILQGLFGCVIAMFMARGLSLLLPFRVRPIHNSELALQIPDTLSRGLLDGWNSLPSDHAALAFAVATVIFLICRVWGTWAFIHAALIICFPRAYLGLHYLTDLSAGALVGILSIYLTMRVINTTKIADFFLAIEKSKPAVFYIAGLLLASQMMQMFNGVRGFASIVATVYRGHL